jgi:hypothetical protein
MGIDEDREHRGVEEVALAQIDPDFRVAICPVQGSFQLVRDGEVEVEVAFKRS